MTKIIGFDASRAFTSDRTGTENYSYQLLKALAKTDKKNNYIVYVRPQSITSTIVEDIVKGHKNFHFKEINWIRFWTQVGMAFQTFKDKLDVLFIPAHTLPLIRRPGLKTVVTVHDLGAEYLPKMHQLKQRLYLKWITHFQLKTATKLIAVSKATRDDLVKRVGCDPEKIQVVYEGYDKKLFRPVQGDRLMNTLRQYDIVPGNYFLFVGTVQPRKNLERLIKAFAALATQGDAFRAYRFKRRRLSCVKLVIVGSRGWLSDQIYDLPKKLGIENQVKFLGYVPEEDLPALYSGAIALTFPSLFEGFGLPILEAQACGCPVLTSNISSMPEVAGKGATYVNPNLTEDIIRGMGEVQPLDFARGKSSKLKVKNLVKAGFENIKRFSWDKCAAQTLKVLENL